MREIPIYPPLRDCQISLSYTDRGGSVIKYFENVDQLAAFFKENPQIAKHFGYVPKKNNKPKSELQKDDPVKETMKRFLETNVLTGYDDTGVHRCASQFLIEKISLGWVKTAKGKKYLEDLEKGLL